MALRPLTSLRTLGLQNLILMQAHGLDHLTQLQLVKVKSGPDLEFEGRHPNVAVEYSQVRHYNLLSSRYDDDNDMIDFDDEEDEEY